MSTIARLEVIPTREGSMADAVASAVDALDRFDVSYETTATDTIIEADDVSEVFAAAEAAHRAVADDRVITSLEVDETRTRAQNRRDRVASVEQRLGRPAKRERQTPATQTQKAQLRKYHGPVREGTGRWSGTPPTSSQQGEASARATGSQQSIGSQQRTDTQQKASRYLQTRQPTPR